MPYFEVAIVLGWVVTYLFCSEKRNKLEDSNNALTANARTYQQTIERLEKESRENALDPTIQLVSGYIHGLNTVVTTYNGHETTTWYNDVEMSDDSIKEWLESNMGKGRYESDLDNDPTGFADDLCEDLADQYLKSSYRLSRTIKKKEQT